jgi:hypothetical protein
VGFTSSCNAEKYMRTFILSIVSICFLSMQAIAQPITIEKINGKTGQFELTISERTPLSAPAEIAKRLHVKPEQLGVDYDLSKETFDVYVPPKPGDDGKYGLMPVIHFEDGHGFPPTAWLPLLDKYHLIWIGPANGSEERSSLERIGSTLDVTAAARKTWPIDDARIYLSINTTTKDVSGMGLLYPDIFSGVISGLRVAWFEKIIDAQRRTWDADAITRPSEPYFTMAKTRSRFFFASRDENRADADNMYLITYQHGYQQAGFKHIKQVKVSMNDMAQWYTYSAGWFEQGVEFLDSTAADFKNEPTTQTASVEENTPTSKPTSVAEKSADPEAKAAAALSLAKNYVRMDKLALARPKLQKIIDDYPGTIAAKDAQVILKEIADQ